MRVKRWVSRDAFLPINATLLTVGFGDLQEIMEKTSITHHHNFAPDGDSTPSGKSPVVNDDRARDSELLDEMAKASLAV